MAETTISIIGVYKMTNVDRSAETLAINAIGTDIHGAGLPQGLIDQDRLHGAKVHFSRILKRSVLVEIGIKNCKSGFDDSVLCQPGGAKYEDHYLGSCFDVCYLAEDGEAVIGDTIQSLPENTCDFRVATYQYLWDVDLPIRTPFGDYRCPLPVEMPTRILNLVPYYAGD